MGLDFTAVIGQMRFEAQLRAQLRKEPPSLEPDSVLDYLRKRKDEWLKDVRLRGSS